MLTKKGTCYICLAGHIDAVPSMGMYLSCQYPIAIVGPHGHVAGQAPCGNSIVEVPDPDGALEAAFRVGGLEAARAVYEARRESAPAAPAGR